MLVRLLKSKLHRAVVTDTRLDYAGSVAIDAELMKAAGIVPYEAVLVADLDNGNRLESYAVPADAGSGQVVMLGAAAQLVKKGDTIIILSFGFLTPEEARDFTPKVIVLDADNKIVK